MSNVESKLEAKEVEISLESKIQNLENELNAQKKVVKNTLRFSIIVGILALFFVALNFSVLVTLAGGVAGTDRKINAVMEKMESKKDSNAF